VQDNSFTQRLPPNAAFGATTEAQRECDGSIQLVVVTGNNNFSTGTGLAFRANAASTTAPSSINLAIQYKMQ